MKKIILLVISHALFLGVGFGAGIYFLPILTAPPAPKEEVITSLSTQAEYTGHFRRDLKDSDALHWGEGELYINNKTIAFLGKLAPGSDYKLYLSKEFVETENDFNRLKSQMVRVGDIKTFENFILNLPDGIEPEQYTSVIIWCESFGQFITAAKYQ